MTFSSFTLTASACAAALALAGCGSDNATVTDQPEAVTSEVAPAGPSMMAVARLRTAQGADAGTATATADNGAIKLAITGKGLTMGDHGVHIHMVGSCDAPTFESAGAHWNPGGTKHGLSNPAGHHGGDMPNLTVATDGTATMSYVMEDADLTEMLDADGAAIVIHDKPDDQMTDPSGNSGDRIACGVFTRG